MTHKHMAHIETPEERYRHGIIAAVIAYTMWGLFPIYFKIVGDVSSLEMLAHRVVWSVPFGALIIIGRKQWHEVVRALIHVRTLLFLVLSAIFIALNWLVYIWAVQHEQIFQASLGYYINPLVYVVVGIVFFGERLRIKQIIAVALAAIGVGVLTFSGGEFPVISVTLAISFTIYGVIRKQVVVGGMPGLFIETLVMLPVAGIYLFSIVNAGSAAFTPAAPGLMILLFLAGPLTVVPLLCFALAARRLDLSMVGFLQFIGPSGQFLVGVAYGEPLTRGKMVCFILIWSAVIIFAFDAWRISKARRLAAQAA